MPPGGGDAEAVGQGLEAVVLEVGEEELGEEEGVQEGGWSRPARRRKARSKAPLWATSTVSWTKARKAGRTASRGLVPEHLRREAVDRRGRGGDGAPRVHQGLKHLLPQDPPAQDVDPGEGHHGVLLGVQARGFQVKGGVEELVQGDVLEARRHLEEGEVVDQGPGGGGFF